MVLFRASISVLRHTKTRINPNNLTVASWNLNTVFPQKSHSLTQFTPICSLHHLAITRNLELITNEKPNTQVRNLELTKQRNTPVVVLLSWLLSKRKHVLKYAAFYLEQGFDVLHVSLTPWQLLFPTKGSQLVAGDLLKYLERNEGHKPVLLHGFSVGGYVWGEALVQIVQNEQRFKPVTDRIVGQIWDSIAEITEITVGVPRAMFPKNPGMQFALRQYMIYHLKAFDKVATKHYIRSSQMYHTSVIKTPALIFVSKKDPVGTVSANQSARENWESKGQKVYWKCFDNSPHVGHFQKYPKEYLTELYNFLDALGLIQNPEKIRARL